MGGLFILGTAFFLFSSFSLGNWVEAWSGDAGAVNNACTALGWAGGREGSNLLSSALMLDPVQECPWPGIVLVRGEGVPCPHVLGD